MDNESVEQYIDVAIVNWWNTLKKRITLIKDSQNVPVLIALSRKMPRLFKLLTEQYLPEFHPEIPIKAILEGCELTTELAIPFLATRKDFYKKSFILLDDIIIHGTTLKNVASDLELLASSTEGTTPFVCYLSCIFKYRLPSVMPSCVSLDDIDSVRTLTLQETKDVIGNIAKKLRSSNLPLDMEYPIFRCNIEDGVSEQNIDSILKSCNPIATYQGAWHNTITALFDNGESLNPYDFAKLRAFISNKEIVFESFTPYILPDFLSSDIDLFINPYYIELWQIVYSPLKEFVTDNVTLFSGINGESLRSSIGRSLVVVANYLLSLSFFITNCRHLLPDTIRERMKIDEEDIKLIFGEELCRDVTKRLRYIIAEDIKDLPQVNFDYTVKDWFAPHDFVDKYSLHKAMLASHSSSIQDVLSGIFKFQNFANPEYDKPQYRYERLFYGETLSSLINSCQPYFSEQSVSINKWVDDQIDNGAVVPKYELCITADGNRRWRRFFHAGLNMTEE